jgi:hypothetical protein
MTASDVLFSTITQTISTVDVRYIRKLPYGLLRLVNVDLDGMWSST